MCIYDFSYLKTCKCNWSSQTECYLFPLSLLKLVGDGIHCWGKGAHAGTEMCARID